MVPETRYTRSGDINIAYQVLGESPVDLVVVPGWISNLEVYWEQPDWARFTRRLASFARVILFDKRGTGMSDRVTGLPTLEVRMDDVRAVMEAVGSERAALFGWSEGGPMCGLFAATYPERTAALIMAGSYARRMRSAEYPWGMTKDNLEAQLQGILDGWGTTVGMAVRCASRVGDAAFESWWARLLRQSATPGTAIALARMNAAVDVRNVLPVISVPTLVLHARGEKLMDVGEARYLAGAIPGARLVEYDSVDHVPFLEGSEFVTDKIEEFLTGTKSSPVEVDRVLATVMFSDIVGATDTAAKIGDRRWHDLLSRHHDLVRAELARFRGKEIDTAGDGFFAAFDGPARAIRCACAVRDAARSLGMEIRSGVHTGECVYTGEKLAGIAVHIGARVAGLAAPGEVLVSQTVHDLVAGSGLAFEERGARTLKGVPGEWHIYSVL